MLLAVCMAACKNHTDAPASEPTPAVQRTEEPQTAVMRLKIAEVHENTLLCAGVGDKALPGELYAVSGAYWPYGRTIEAGMTVDVTYNGEVLESYPMELCEPELIKLVEDGGDLVGMYRRACSDLYEQDTALNADITLLAFDLSGAVNLTGSEKSALIYLVAGEYGLEPLTGTYQELCDSGYIDADELYFHDGLLFTINEVEEQSETAFTFSIAKWRSGLGALGMSGCTAELKDCVWSYAPGGMWIS